MPVICANEITKVYPERQGPRVLFGRGGMLDWFRPRADGFAALKGVSLEVNAGESLGIIGGNGSGKSTLLKILAGVTLPTSGNVTGEGRVASLLELGAGFHPMLTGRENIYLNAAIYGLHRAEVDALFESIVEFSGIREFIDRPVDTYSSGMYVRIAFSVAIHMNPDVFLVDEVLAVGDEDFQRKCRRKIGELREQGKTIVFVSHDLGIVNTVCDRVVLLNKGELLERGTPQQTFDYYLRQVGQAAGIHRLAWEEHEALFSNGKVSLFKNQKETTGPEGLFIQLESMGQHHASINADWKITEAMSCSFVAEGTMPRVPCVLRLAVRILEGTLELSLSLTAEHDFVLDAFSLIVPLPADMEQWSFDGNLLTTQALTPAHVQAEAAAMPDSESREVTAFSSRSNSNAALRMAFESTCGTYLHLINGDYLSGVRRLHWDARPAPAERCLRKGSTFSLGVVSINPSLSGDAARSHAKALEVARECIAGGISAQLRKGNLCLKAMDGAPLADVQFLFCCDDLWSNSAALISSPAHKSNEVVHMSSRATRLPITLLWRMEATGEGIALDLALEAQSPVVIREYNLSLLLPAGYTQWQQPENSGVFPAFKEEQEWQPLPMPYVNSCTLQLSGEGLPALHWRTNTPGALPSVLNTGAGQHKRVAQWLRRPEGADAFYFEPGAHPLLSVVIGLGPTP